ncbi:MAG TPA: DUF655 domain-containing protein, partial [Nautiliaceae bacterium]|nr:DUF655 domain-containing protein [Nautiliaceae bacterium]
QALGVENFLLLEFVKPKDLEVKILGEMPLLSKYRLISYDSLTQTARENLKNALISLIEKREKDFIEFINKSTAITPRLHMLETLPHIGKRITWKIVEEKEKKPFENFSEIEERIKIKFDIKGIIMERIIEELQNKDKYKLFVGPNSFLKKVLSSQEKKR